MIASIVGASLLAGLYTWGTYREGQFTLFDVLVVVVLGAAGWALAWFALFIAAAAITDNFTDAQLAEKADDVTLWERGNE